MSTDFSDECEYRRYKRYHKESAMQPPQGKIVNHDDGPEEGEIVSDDLEDISDDSTFFAPTTGKSLSRRDQLHALSLSNITEQDELMRVRLQKRRKCINRRHARHRKKLKIINVADSESSDDNHAPNSRLRKQLNAAVRVDADETNRNSLRTRLKPMVQLASDSEQNDNTLVKEPDLFIDIVSSDSDTPVAESVQEQEDDSELRQLRLEALKTAIANKFGKLKNKKKDENKENNVNNGEVVESASEQKTEVCIENHSSTKRNDISNDPVCPEEDDEDVLRALLLASISKKITRTKSESTQTKVLPEQIKNKAPLTHFKTASVTSSNVKVNNVENKIITTVKPLIICVDSNSSDSDCPFSPVKVADKEKHEEKPPSEIENSVDKFLKEQRAKVELQKKIQPKPVNVRSAIVKQPAKTTLNKSALECLPKEKQKEYKNLVLMIRKAELKKPRPRKTSIRSNETMKPIITPSKTTSTKSSTISAIATAKLRQNKAKLIANRTLSNIGTPGPPTKSAPVRSLPKLDEKTSTNQLQKTLKEIQLRRSDGRFQVQEKYKLLQPLVKNIHDMTKEQRVLNENVKRILEQLTEAKRNEQDCQKKLNGYIKELINKKQRIDRGLMTGMRIAPPIGETVVNKLALTSTVTNTVTRITNASKTVSNDPTRVTSTTKTTGISDIAPKKPLETPTNLKEPTQTASQYVSPLDSKSKAQNLDPFIEFCPFDVNGTCKDTDCKYNHVR